MLWSVISAFRIRKRQMLAIAGPIPVLPAWCCTSDPTSCLLRSSVLSLGFFTDGVETCMKERDLPLAFWLRTVSAALGVALTPAPACVRCLRRSRDHSTCSSCSDSGVFGAWSTLTGRTPLNLMAFVPLRAVAGACGVVRGGSATVKSGATLDIFLVMWLRHFSQIVWPTASVTISGTWGAQNLAFCSVTSYLRPERIRLPFPSSHATHLREEW